MRNAFVTALMLASLTGCASLTPYQEVVESLPAERLIEVDGQQIYVESHGSGPVVLMLHGFASSTYSFREIIPPLAKTHRVVAIDLNGFGFTERPEELDRYEAASQVETIRRLLDILRIRRCDVIGHSYGGALAVLLAEMEPSRIRSLALISPYTEFEKTPVILRSQAGRNLARGGTRLLVNNRTVSRLGLMRAFHQDRLVAPEVADEYRRRILIEGFDDMFDGYSLAMVDGPLKLPLATTEQPVFIIAGRHDKLVSVESCQRTAEMLPNAMLRILEDSGHSAAEEQPKEVVRLIKEFLRR